MAKKVKKLEEVVKEETLEEQPIEETTEAELPKVEFKEEIAPKSYSGLVQPQKQNDELRMKDGRIYKEVGNGLGMFLDNGTTFRI